MTESPIFHELTQIQQDELRALRTELMARILMQNGLLMLSVFAFAVIASLGFLFREHQWQLCAIHTVVIFAFALQWCHHGVRTMQIKRYILTLEPPSSHSWENWLPANRPKRMLGTRWLVSTKGVFLGVQLAAMAFAVMSSSLAKIGSTLGMISAVTILITAGFLFTNPKE